VLARIGWSPVSQSTCGAQLLAPPALGISSTTILESLNYLLAAIIFVSATGN
jgi:hypothetical protein